MQKLRFRARLFTPLLIGHLFIGCGAALGYAGPAPSPTVADSLTRAEDGLSGYLIPRIQTHLRRLPNSAACRADYAGLFAQDQVDVRIALGYDDFVDLNRPANDPGAVIYTYFDNTLRTQVSLGYNGSSDGFLRVMTERFLRQPCTGDGIEACGFVPTAAPGELIKAVPALDGSNRQVAVRVHLTQSSYTPFYDYNVGPARAEQDRMTAACEENLFGGLETADVILYNGHARAGGGPDCSPVVRNEFKHPDYAGHYRRNTPGVQRMTSALNRRRLSGRPSPYFIGLFACESQQHFSRLIRALAPDSRVAVTSVVVDDAYAVAAGPVEALDAILRRQCAGPLRESFSLPTEGSPGARNQGRPTNSSNDFILLDPRAPRR